MALMIIDSMRSLMWVGRLVSVAPRVFEAEPASFPKGLKYQAKKHSDFWYKNFVVLVLGSTLHAWEFRKQPTERFLETPILKYLAWDSKRSHPELAPALCSSFCHSGAFVDSNR